MSFRKSRQIALKERILVLTEGESELIYLKGYRSEDQNRRGLSGVEIEMYKPQNHSPIGLVKEAKRRVAEAKRDKLPFKRAWIVFDRDGHANIGSAIEEARTANPPINVAFSSMCFEYWILLHFEKTKKSFLNCGKVASYIRANHLEDLHKTLNFYPLLQNRITTAIANAKWLHEQNADDIKNGFNIYDLASYTSFDSLIVSLEAVK
jgi:hypothetical protein